MFKQLHYKYFNKIINLIFKLHCNLLFNEIINLAHFTALHFAAHNNNIEMVKLLLSTPNINVNSQTIANSIF